MVERIKSMIFGRSREILYLAHYFVLTRFAYAQQLEITKKEDVMTKIICPLAGWMFSILVGLSIVMALVGGFLYLTSGGDSDKTSKATRTLTYAAVAIVVAFIAFGFPKIIISIFASGTERIKTCKP